MDDVQVGNGNDQKQEVGQQIMLFVWGKRPFQKKDEQKKQADPQLDGQIHRLV